MQPTVAPLERFNGLTFQRFNDSHVFPRNTPPNPAQYISERPELTFYGERSRRPKQSTMEI
jgi:hypothetical protein